MADRPLNLSKGALEAHIQFLRGKREPKNANLCIKTPKNFDKGVLIVFRGARKINLDDLKKFSD